MDTKHNGFTHLTKASELQNVICDLGDTLYRLRSLLRVADGLEDGGLKSEDAREDLCNVVHVSAAMAATAKEICDKAEGQSGALARRMEDKPEPGDRFPGEALSLMFEALISRGGGCTAYELSRLATTLGAYAQHDAAFKPAFDVWIRWMHNLGIETVISKSAQRVHGEFSVGVVSAPGCPDAIIDPDSIGSRQ